jgi:chemosensory pili system protein ChpA (sensor histidine kinase/response regulator)
MLVRCPQCKTEFRLVDYEPDSRVVRYLCPGCEEIVRIDLKLDEVPSSSSPDSYSALDRRKTVLIADDAETVRGLAGTLLNDAGYRVLLAADGVEALELISSEHPDLVVLDLLMPRMTGFEVLRAVRQDERIRETPVMAMSGVYAENVMGFLQELDVLGFLTKGQLRENLVFRAERILAGAEPAD